MLNVNGNDGWQPPADLPPVRSGQSEMTPEKGRIARYMRRLGHQVFDIAVYLDVNPGRVSGSSPRNVVIT